MVEFSQVWVVEIPLERARNLHFYDVFSMLAIWRKLVYYNSQGPFATPPTACPSPDMTPPSTPPRPLEPSTVPNRPPSTPPNPCGLRESNRTLLAFASSTKNQPFTFVSNDAYQPTCRYHTPKTKQTTSKECVNTTIANV